MGSPCRRAWHQREAVALGLSGVAQQRRRLSLQRSQQRPRGDAHRAPRCASPGDDRQRQKVGLRDHRLRRRAVDRLPQPRVRASGEDAWHIRRNFLRPSGRADSRAVRNPRLIAARSDDDRQRSRRGDARRQDAISHQRQERVQDGFSPRRASAEGVSHRARFPPWQRHVQPHSRFRPPAGRRSEPLHRGFPPIGPRHDQPPRLVYLHSRHRLGSHIPQPETSDVAANPGVRSEGPQRDAAGSGWGQEARRKSGECRGGGRSMGGNVPDPADVRFGGE